MVRALRPSQRRCPSEPSLSPRAPCCPSRSDRPLDPRLGGRSPVLPLPSSDATVRLPHRPTVLFHFPLEHLPGVPLEILLQDSFRHLYPLRVGSFWVKQSDQGDVKDVDDVHFRVGFLS